MAKIDSRLVSLYFDPQKMGVKKEKKEKIEYDKGDILTLKGEECDSFSMPYKKYEVIKSIDTFSNIVIDSYVVKQIEGEQSTIFSLTKQDCKSLGIEFQPFLQILPKSMDWTCEDKDIKEKEFNPNDFSTYPVNKDNKLITHFVLKIENVFVLDGYSTLFQIGDISRIDIETLYNGFYLKLKSPLKMRNGINSMQVRYYGRNVTHNLFSHVNVNETINSCIYLEFNIPGIEPDLVENTNFNEIFDLHVNHNSLVRVNELDKYTLGCHVLPSEFDAWRKYNLVWNLIK